nr:ExeM/NucH family extracellular endonuclease [Acidimicrobiia bacterium]
AVAPDQVHTAGLSWQRADLTEGVETRTGGNGLTGNDETSENGSTTWIAQTPTPSGEKLDADHLLLSEFLVDPAADVGEFVEIYNPTAATIDLSNVYLTDATFAPGGTFYYEIVEGGGGGGGFGDFHARFPAGASIDPGVYQTVALSGGDDFFAAHGVDPTYELYEDMTADSIPNMLEATAGSIDGQGGLSSGEVVVLYYWDGATDLVMDLDYVVFGDKNEAVDKTGVAIDGPDGDTDTSSYLPDTSVASQDAVAPDQVHTAGLSWQRADLTEGVETRTGGNGLTGNDETSEVNSITWGETAPTPNAATTLPPPPTGGGLDPLPPLGVCGDPFTAIYDLQGATPDGAFDDGTPALTEGVVTGVFPGYSGFNIQDATGDSNAATSDGIFVSADTTGVTVGDTVRVLGRTMELFGLTQIDSVDEVLDCGAGPVITPTAIDFPLADREPFEGMLVTLADTMVATDTFNLPNFGEVWIAADSVVPQPTNVFPVGDASLQDLADENMARSIILDDGSTSAPAEVPYLPDGGTLRLGDLATPVTGVMHFSFGQFRINPTVDVSFIGANPRPLTAPAVGGEVVVASYNVLNYWTTLGGRGASSADQLAEQTDGLVAAIMNLGADIVGLQEMENDPTHTPITTLVDELNAAEGSTVWAWVGEVDYYNDYPIRNEIIYRIGAVDPVGDPVTIEDPAFDDIAPGGTSQLGRPPVAQTFSVNGETFTVMSNHFKSKSCTAASGADADMSDGQACYNARRVLQAERVLEFVTDLQTSTGDPDVIVLGDLNAYMAEDPILELETGLTNVFAEMVDDPYTYNFFAASSAPWIGRGNLDHILVTPEMAHKVSGIDAWHINGDEPNMLGWSNPAVSAPGPYRSSDHDPIVMGLRVPAPFLDTTGSIFAADIQWVAEAGITRGCNPPLNDLYCPADLLTRGQLAAMFVRALHLPATTTDFFTDDDTSIFEDDINRLAAAGITRGCNPPANDNFCPLDNVTRGQVAAMFVRALDLPATTTDYFTDDDTSIFGDDINRLAAAGITRGCNPPANDNYCPDDVLNRGQMAAFWHRALGQVANV